MDACVIRLVVFSLSSLVFVNSFLVSSGPRKVVQTLGPTYLSQFGSWGQREFCAHGAFATGYNLRIQPSQHGYDDTSLNAIQLNCTILDGHFFGGTISSAEGVLGQWGREVSCQRHNNFLTEFRIQVEGNQHSGDDTAANYIEFKCREISGERYSSVQLPWGVGHGLWGAFSEWYYCPTNSAICGIQTRVEAYIGDGDDTTLNDVKLFCCT